MRNGNDADALVIGAGPAGASTAILLKLAGWRVILVEKSAYPRQKVCGECLSAASLALLDQLGVGAAVRDRAGPELHQVGWMSGASTSLPTCLPVPTDLTDTAEPWDATNWMRFWSIGRVELGVILIQPGKVRSVRGEWGISSVKSN
jgi:2-polyprenyl-6-methoxyphenol hydroxylase-like FAD-dependent oxidoreductase